MRFVRLKRTSSGSFTSKNYKLVFVHNGAESNTLPLSRILAPSCPSVRLLWIDTESHTDLLWNVSLLGLEEVHSTPGKSNEKLVTPVKNFKFLFFLG